MPDIRVTPKTTPRCPNHGVALEGCGFPLPAKGEGRCPVSTQRFTFSVDGSAESMKPVKDADGNITMEPSWHMIGESPNS